MFIDLSTILIGIYIGIIGTVLVGARIEAHKESREERAWTGALKASTVTQNEVRHSREATYPWGSEPISDDPFTK